MSGKAFGWARDLRGLSGKGPAKAVLLLMADYADGERSLYPSVSTMAEELEITERTVQRAIGSLLADGLIEREFRTTGTGKNTSSRYVLRLDRAAPVGAGGVSDSHPSGVSDGRGDGDCVTPSPRTKVTIHMNLYSEPESSDELSNASARADEAFDQVKAIWPAEGLDRTNVPAARETFHRQADEIGDPAALVAAARSAVEAATWRKGSHGAPSLNTWLDQRRWEGRLPGRGEVVGLEAATRRSAVPQPVLDAFAAVEGSGWTASWAAPCGWDEATRALRPRNGVAAERLRAAWPGAAMAALGVTLGEIERAAEAAAAG